MQTPNLHDIETIFIAVSLIAILLLIGLWLRTRSAWLARLYLPGSVVAGLLALCLGPDILGKIAGTILGPQNVLESGLFGSDIPSIWRSLPSLLINIVFAGLFLGKSIPSLPAIWRLAGPVVCYGQSIAWGQYVVGLSLTLLVLVPFYDMNPMVGALIEIGFEGGHGTAAGLAPVFESLNYAEGVDMALGLASVGLLSAILSGIVLIGWARRRGYLEEEKAQAIPASGESMATLLDGTSQEREPSDEPAIDPFSLHLGLIAVAVLIGWLLLEALVALESVTWGRDGFGLLSHVPLFPMAMIGGALVQIVVERRWGGNVIDREIINRISGVALDVIIVAALATLSLSVIADNLVPFLLLAIAGVAWNIIGFVVLAPRLIPGNWFPRGIASFGQSMGMTVTGILLYKMADPGNRSGGLEGFGYKQLMFEPVVGGGIFTAMSLPLIFEFGAFAVLILTACLLAFWLITGFMLFGRNRG